MAFAISSRLAQIGSSGGNSGRGARRAYPKETIRPRPPAVRDLADPVHMPRNEMASEAVGHPQRLFEVDCARLAEPHGATQGFAGHVHAESLLAALHYREANPV